MSTNKRVRNTAKEAKTRAKQRAHALANIYIERIWAEDGLIHSIDIKGIKKMRSIAEAAKLAVGINLQLSHIHHLMKDPANSASDLKQQLDSGYTFIKKVAELCREARKQIDSGDNKTKMMQNLVQGLDIHGKKPVVTDEDTIIERYMFQYPTLSEQDIRAIVRAPTLPPNKTVPQILSHMHSINISRGSGFNANFVL